MSTWTHVAATIRFDALRLPGIPSMKPDLGLTFSFEDDERKWDECNTPRGSEGSIQHHLWENPDKSCLAAYTATIWGDLRDYDSPTEVIEYLKRICAGKMVRQGVAEIAVEGNAPVVVLYLGNKWVEVGQNEIAVAAA